MLTAQVLEDRSCEHMIHRYVAT